MPEVSSTYGSKYGKQYLTDGKKQHTSNTRGFWHSVPGKDQWAKIAFQERSTIDKVRVTNRCDCCEETRLTGAKVFIGQSGGGAETQCGGSIPFTARCTDAVVVCGGVAGDYVVVRHSYWMLSGQSLNIVEMEAYTGRRNHLSRCVLVHTPT